MSFDFGEITLVIWNMHDEYNNIGTFCTDLCELKEPAGVRVQAKYSYGNWSLIVLDFNKPKKIQLQLKWWLSMHKHGCELKHFLQEDWSEVSTVDRESPTIKLAMDANLSDFRGTYVDLIMQIRPAYEMASTCHLQCNLMPAIVSAFNDEETADAKVKVGDSTFNVHKLVICTQSAVFKSMFKHELSEKKSNIVDIKDVDEEVVETMLRYLYSGKVENMEQVASRLLSLSDQYQLDGLTTMCMNALGKNLTLENIIERLQLLAHPEHLNAFKMPVFEFVKENFASIRELSTWEEFQGEHKDLVNELLAFFANN
ncbi:Speckle-type POZ protein A-like protein [Aphelenchoides besseyi]|nr:Speckle-type POZ protein A-like protein [Aphelenchoides besseyi]